MSTKDLKVKSVVSMTSLVPDSTVATTLLSSFTADIQTHRVSSANDTAESKLRVGDFDEKSRAWKPREILPLRFSIVYNFASA